MPEWLKLIVPSLTTAVCGGFLLQLFFVRRSNQAALIDHIIKELVELRNEALDYWSQRMNPDSPEALKQLENRIKGRIHSLVKDTNAFTETIYFFHIHLAKNFSRKVLFGFDTPELPPKKARYLAAMLEVHEACTGGDFESEQHLADSSRYFAICTAISDAKSALFRVKL